MSMRVPNLMTNAQSLLDLQRIKQAYANAVQQVSTGQAIVNIGDDPAGTAQIMQYQSAITQNQEYISQGSTATGQLQAASTALSTMNNDLTRLMELAEEGLSGSATAASNQDIATEVQGLRTDLISLGNTQWMGNYVFGGSNTTGAAPFVDNGNGTVTYNGNNQVVNLDLSATATVSVNIPGSTLFFGTGGQGSSTDILAQAAALTTALNANDNAGIQAAYTNLQTIAGQFNVSAGDLGSRANGITALDNGLSAYNQTLTSQQSAIASVNYPNAITALNEDGVAEQATLETMAKSNAKTLFDYIA